MIQKNVFETYGLQNKFCEIRKRAEREGIEPSNLSLDIYLKISHLQETIKLKIILVSEITSSSNNDLKVINFLF